MRTPLRRVAVSVSACALLVLTGCGSPPQSAPRTSPSAAPVTATPSPTPRASENPDLHAEPSTADPVDGWMCPLPAGSYFVSEALSAIHPGVDLAARDGTPVYAARGGQVVTSTDGYGRYGVGIVIDHEDGTTTTYASLIYGSRRVETGDAVQAGDVIGFVGATGIATNAHLHLELHFHGLAADPLEHLPI